MVIMVIEILLFLGIVAMIGYKWGEDEEAPVLAYIGYTRIMPIENGKESYYKIYVEPARFKPNGEEYLIATPDKIQEVAVNALKKVVKDI